MAAVESGVKVFKDITIGASVGTTDGALDGFIVCPMVAVYVATLLGA